MGILKKRLESLKSKVLAAEIKPAANNKSNELEDLETENAKLKYQVNQLKRVSALINNLLFFCTMDVHVLVIKFDHD